MTANFITDRQFEAIILRVDSGESMASIQADFPHLTEDLVALQDLQDFFAAQRSTVKPDPQGLKSVLRQVDLLRQENMDDDRTWGSFFLGWKRAFAVALPALLVLGVGSYLWQPPLPELNRDSQIGLPEATSVSEASVLLSRQAPVEAQVMSLNQENEVLRSDMDMEALVQSLSDEFASDMAEFETTRDSLAPLFSDQLFSYNDSTTL